MSDDTSELGHLREGRERWQHEDQLVNERTTFLLKFQGALGGAYGYLLYRVADVHTFGVAHACADIGSFLANLNRLSMCLLAIGLVSALAALAGILAANRAQDELNRQYKCNLGVSALTTQLGHAVAVATPIICIVAWLGSLILLR